jgi:hypothetical protein
MRTTMLVRNATYALVILVALSLPLVLRRFIASASRYGTQNLMNRRLITPIAS